MQTGTCDTTTDELTRAADDAYAVMNASTLAFLRRLDGIEQSEGWKEDGVRSLEDWVTYRFSFSQQESVEYVRTMRKLRYLPKMAATFGAGAIPWRVLVDLVTFVEPSEDEVWAERAQYTTPSLARRWARHARRIKREEAALALNKRSLSMFWDAQKDLLRLSGVFPGAEGAAVKKAIERIAERYGPEPDGKWERWDKRCADALVELAGTRIAQDSDSDRATVVIHVGLDELNYINGKAMIEDGPMVPAEVARRLACDARLQFSVFNSVGETIGIGRVSPSIEPWLRREVKYRDQTCVVCGGRYAHQVHHVIHFAHGGRTDLDNLVLLCRRCHSRVHDHGFKLFQDEHGAWRLLRPDGRPVVTRLENIRPNGGGGTTRPTTPRVKPKARPPARC